MVNRNRTIVRTPRRRKIWARDAGQSVQTVTDNDEAITSDMLTLVRTDLGITEFAGLTVMRMLVKSWIIPSEVTTSRMVVHHVGIAWQTDNIASAAQGDTQIPEPHVTGVREEQWIHRYEQVVSLDEQASPSISNPMDLTKGQYMYESDVRQMRRQPTPGHTLVLTQLTEFESTLPTCNFDFHWRIDMLLALP